MSNIYYPLGLPSLNIGGRIFTDLDNLKIKGASAVASFQNSSMQSPEDGGNYQVPADKKFRILAVKFWLQEQTAQDAGILRLLYSDNAVGMESATAFTNAVYWMNNSNASIIGTLAGAPHKDSYECPVFFDVPATKYPSMNSVHASTARVVANFYGYELDA